MSAPRRNLLVGFLAALSVLRPARARADGPSDAGSAVAVTVAATTAIHITSHGRAVHVVGAARGTEVRVKGAGALSVQVSEDHARVSIVASPQSGEGPIDIAVPAASTLDVRTVRGEITVSDVTGAVRASTVDAPIHVTGSPKEVETATVTGSVELDLTVCDVRASSVGGPIRAQCHGKSSRVHGKSVSAPVSVKGVSFERLELRSVSGIVDAEGAVKGDGPFELRSHSGSVSLSVPKGTPLVVDASSRGRVDVKSSAPDAGARASAPTVTLRSFSGNVTVAEK
jgi:hypothetical protein